MLHGDYLLFLESIEASAYPDVIVETFGTLLLKPLDHYCWNLWNTFGTSWFCCLHGIWIYIHPLSSLSRDLGVTTVCTALWGRMYHCGARASAYPLAPRSGVARAATTETVQILLPPAFISLYCSSRSRAVHVRVQLGIPWTFVHGQESIAFFVKGWLSGSGVLIVWLFHELHS